MKPDNKIFNLKSLLAQIDRWRTNKKSIVFTNGCFDLLHLGHVDYLSRAAELGDKLIVAVNSDESVRSLDKGNSRPLQDETSRCGIIAALQVVDAAIVFSETTPLTLIKAIKPTVLVKGGDWKTEDIVGFDVVNDAGGQVHSLALVDGYSTTAIENKIKQSIP